MPSLALLGSTLIRTRWVPVAGQCPDIEEPAGRA
jgi:hypothetical protein